MVRRVTNHSKGFSSLSINDKKLAAILLHNLSGSYWVIVQASQAPLRFLTYD